VRELLDLLARWSGEAHEEEPVVARENSIVAHEHPVLAPGHPATTRGHPEETLRPSTEPPSGTEQDELEDFLL